LLNPLTISPLFNKPNEKTAIDFELGVSNNDLNLTDMFFKYGFRINPQMIKDEYGTPLKLASGKELDRIVMEKLRWLDLVHAKDNLPGDISGGMKKRAGIARALTTNPEILLYDEPTSGLDAFTAMNIIATIKKIAQEQQCVSISFHKGLSPKISCYWQYSIVLPV
jgi:ABC-type dipeptide/oligopeptide/nickel transport system ATPase component